MNKINKDTKIRWSNAYKKSYNSDVNEITCGKVVLHTVDGVVNGEKGDFIVKDINGDYFIITKENIKYNYENFITPDNVEENKDILNLVYKSDDFSMKCFIATRIQTKIKYACIYNDFELETTNGKMYGKAFDYIIKTPKTGYLYRIDADVFSKTYVVEKDYCDELSNFSFFANGSYFKFKGLDVDYIINTLLVQELEDESKKQLWDRVKLFMNKMIQNYRETVTKQDYPLYEDWSYYERDIEQDGILYTVDELRDIILQYYMIVIRF